ncbi:uncharacterized protein [Hetaerina americana]|uniref:uncharacterized protein n=1 Tax=Hetaerina americana TaxID=62018 RepID=UPI003A7F39C9
MANVKVAVRVRPFSEREVSECGRPVVNIREDCVEVTNIKVPEHAEGDSRERVRRFAFDLCFDSTDPASPHHASQEMVYQRLGCEVLDALLSGYNACVLAYGQSGSGKTYTMAGGVEGEKKDNGEIPCPPATRGLTPRICEGLFARLRAASSSPCARSPSSLDKAAPKVRVSFLEIYKERVRDLLRPDDGPAPTCRPPFILRVREHPRHGPYVQGLSAHVVEDASSLAALVSRGEGSRRTGSTVGNPRSSRGHALLAICPLHHHAPRLHLVDLAGSERAPSSGGAGRSRSDGTEEGNDPTARLKEGASINRSLVTLGNVISALAERCSPPPGPRRRRREQGRPEEDPQGAAPSAAAPTSLFVPYRDSVLTWLLKDSLGGNSKTVMVAAISPSSTCYSETISTLRYAQRTKRIVNSPVVNGEDPNARIIRELRAEVRKLRGMLLSAQMAESLHCRQPDGGAAAGTKEAEEGWREPGVQPAPPLEAVADGEPFYLQGCQREGTGTSEAAVHCDDSSDGDDTPTASLTERPPGSATRCATMGREDSGASETTTAEEETTPPTLGAGTPCGRDPLARRPFGGSCELIYPPPADGPAPRPRGRSLPSGGIWPLRRQSSMDGPHPPPLRAPHDGGSSSSVDSKGSADSSRGRARGKGAAAGPTAPPKGGVEVAAEAPRGRGARQSFAVRTGVAEARRRAAEQARRRAEIVAAVTRRLYPNKRRGASEGGAGEGGEEGRTEAEGEAATAAAEGGGGGEGGGGASPGEEEACVPRARFRLLSRRALGAARRAPPRPSHASAVTQTEGGETREAGVGTEAPGEGLPLGPLARGVLARILTEVPLRPDDAVLDKWFSEDSLESSGSEDEADDCGPQGGPPAATVVWGNGEGERPVRPLTRLFRECKGGGWGGPPAAPDPPSLETPTAECGPREGPLADEGGREKVREWQMRTLAPDSFEEAEGGLGGEREVAPEEGAAPTPGAEAEEGDSWGDSSCDDASVSSADSDFLFLPPPPSAPAPAPPVVRRQLYTITENSEQSDFSDAASAEAVSRRSTPPSSLEPVPREEWRARSGARAGGGGVRAGGVEASEALPSVEVTPAGEGGDVGGGVGGVGESPCLLPQRKDPDGDREERREGEAGAVAGAGEKGCGAVPRAGEEAEVSVAPGGCERCGGGRVPGAGDDGRRFLSVSVLGRRAEGTAPVSIGMGGEGAMWGEDGAASTASEDSITFVFVGRPSPQRKGSKARPPSALPPVLVELIRRSLGVEGGDRKGSSWGGAEEEGDEGWGRRTRGRAGMRRHRRHGGPLRRSVSVDTAVRALSRFVRMQGMRTSNGRPASTECLVPEDLGAILEQGRLHAVGGGDGGAGGPEESGEEGATGGEGEARGVDSGRGGPEGRGMEARGGGGVGRRATGQGEDPPLRGKGAAGGGPVDRRSTGPPADVAREVGAEGPYRSCAGDSPSRVPRGPEECPLPPDWGRGADEGMGGAGDDFDENYLPSLPRVTLGRSVVRESGPEARRAQLQEMRNVVFGFPEVVVEEEGGARRSRRVREGSKSVSWGDAGVEGGGVRKAREGTEEARPRPIIKRSTSLPAGAPLTGGVSRRPGSSLGSSGLRSPRPDGSFAPCPVHGAADGEAATGGGGATSEAAEEWPGVEEGVEFEEKACRALSDFLVEATSLMEGLCRVSGLSPEVERRRGREAPAMTAQEPPLDAKEVLAALQTRLSDRHLMRSPPRASSKEATLDPPTLDTVQAGDGRRGTGVSRGPSRGVETPSSPVDARVHEGGCSRGPASPGAGGKCGTRLYPDALGAANGYSESRWPPPSLRADAALSDFTLGNCNPLLLNDAAPCPIRRSDSEGLVTAKVTRALHRPSSPDLFPEFGTSRLPGRAEDGMDGASLLGRWSPRATWREDYESDERDFLQQERAWKSSNALNVPPASVPPQHLTPLRESQSDAALCSTTASGKCCLHGQVHHETRVHHHHHHYHHYPPLAGPDYSRTRWGSSKVKGLSWFDDLDDGDDSSLPLWRGSAPQLSSHHTSQSFSDHDYVQAWQQRENSKEADPRGAPSSPGDGARRGRALYQEERNHTPSPFFFTSAPNSPYRRPHLPPSSPSLSPTMPSQTNLASSMHTGPSLIDPSIRPHSLSRPLNLHPPQTHSSPTSPSRPYQVPTPPHQVPTPHTPPTPFSSHGFLTSRGPNDGNSKFQPSTHIPQAASSPLGGPSSSHRRYAGGLSPPLPSRPQPPRPPPPTSSLLFPTTHSPLLLPTDVSWHDGGPPLAASGLSPHAYLRHLVDVRKEVVAATRSCNPHV